MTVPSVSGVSVAPNLYASEIRPEVADVTPAPVPPPAAELTNAVAPSEQGSPTELTPNYSQDGEPTDPDGTWGLSRFDEVV